MSPSRRPSTAAGPWALLALALLGTWTAAAFAVASGRGLPVALTVVPLAGFAAGFAAAREAVRQGCGGLVARCAIGIVVLGSAIGLWAVVDPNDWRAFVIFIGMMATLCPLVTGIAAGAWTGAQDPRR